MTGIKLIFSDLNIFSTRVRTEGLIQHTPSERKLSLALYAKIFGQVLCWARRRPGNAANAEVNVEENWPA